MTKILPVINIKSSLLACSLAVAKAVFTFLKASPLSSNLLADWTKIFTSKPLGISALQK